MLICLRLKGIRYEVDSLSRMLFPNGEITLLEDDAPLPAGGGDSVVISGEPRESGRFCCRIETDLDGAAYLDERLCPDDLHEIEQTVCRLLYERVCTVRGRRLPWGLLTGVRPVKLVRQWFDEGLTTDALQKKLEMDCGVSRERAELCLDTWENQKDLFRELSPRRVSLYLAVPFCPSRCSYCSFVSHSIEKTARLVPEYVACLLREIRETASLAARSGLEIETVYMGGGTPTTFSAEQLAEVLSAVRGEFDLSRCREFTVEAGRPDTITRKKLDVLSRCGVNRISINPQTLNDAVLETIGRRHTVRQFFDAYHLAEEYSFDKNIDLIAGLPGENYDSFRRSVDGILALHAENVTVHTLTIKHAAALREEEARHREAYEMVEYSRRAVRAAGYRPYYLYRQKGTVDCLENVGYSLEGKRCLYNVYIMDDSHTIISVGAGGVTKVILPGEARIQRVFNYKYPYEYISRFETVLERKRALPLSLLDDTIGKEHKENEQ